jgi:hypothetical protein
MASLTGQLVAETYKALLKVIDNDILTASEKQITDGFGGGSNVFIDSQGFLRANKYKVTNGLATQFLKADGSLDTNTYLTSITGAQVITALGYTPVPTTRTITINGETHNLAADNTWTIGGTAAIWGNITGTLSNQTDLQAALNAKFDDPTGNTTQYIDGTGALQTFPTMLSSDNLIKLVRNQSGGTMTAGTIVYINGATGNKPTIAKALATSDATSAQTYGMVQANIANNADGYIVVIGNVNDLNTHSLTEGAQLYLSATTPGAWTTTKQYAPAHLVYVGIVLRSHPTQGIIGVKIQNGYELDELHDVSAQSPTNNDGIFFEASTSLWKNKSIATVLGYTPQAQLSGTGFVKISGTIISYDNSTYLSAADAAATYLALTGGTLSGNLTISSANPKLLLTDTDNNPDYSIQNYNGTFKITDETNSADRFLIYSTGIAYYNGDFKANKLFVEGGLSTQFIKGDGTLDTNTYLTSASLDGYLAKAGGTMTGDLNFYTLKTTRVGGNAYIRGSWQGTYWGIGAAATGHTIIIDQVDFSTGAYESITDVNLMLGTRTVVHSGNVATYALPITGGTVTGSITATSFVKSGGTSAQFLMADGSVTTLSSPVTGSGSAGYIPKWTTAANIGSSLIYEDGTSIGIAYTTPNKGGYGRTLTGASFGSASFGFEAVSNTTTNGGLIGGLSFIVNQNDSSRIVGSAIQSNLVGTTATNYGADLRFYAKADAGVIGEVARMTSAGLRVYGTIVKDGGTSSQYLMADGSISTFSGVSGSGTINYLPKWTSASVLGNSIVSESAGIIDISGQLTVSGQSTFANSVLVKKNGSDSANDALAVVNSAGNRYFNWQLDSIGNLAGWRYSGSAFAQWISVNYSNGSVGINTSSANKMLQVYAGNGDGISIGRNLTTDNMSANLFFFPSALEAKKNWAISAYYTRQSTLQFLYSSTSTADPYSSGTPLMTLDGASGNVLINTTTDSGYKFDVNGTGRFSGNLLVTNATDCYPEFRTSPSDADVFLGFSNIGDGNNAWGVGRRNTGEFWITNFTGNFNSGTRSTILSLSTTGAATFSNIVTSNVQFRVLASGNFRINNNADGLIGYLIRSGAWKGTAENNISLATDGAYGISFFTNGTTTERLHITSGGNVTINNGTTDNGFRFQVNGSTYFGGVIYLETSSYFRAAASTGYRFNNSSDAYNNFIIYESGNTWSRGTSTATSFFESSDIRLKTLIESNPIINGIEKLEAKLYEKNGKIELGYFAQDAELIMPYAVTKNEDGFLNLSYREVHTAKIARLEKRVAELEKQLNVA